MRDTRARTLGELPFQIDTSGRDYVGIRSAITKFIENISPEWTDRNPSDTGMVLVEIMAYVADVLHYQLDRVQNESYLTTAQERINVQQLLRLIDYELSSGTGSSVPICVITDRDAVTIPALTRVSTSDNASSFEFTEAIFLPTAGIYAPSSVKAVVEESLGINVNIKDTLVAVYGTTVTETVGTSDGSAFQTFDLSRGPVSLSPDSSSSLTLQTSDGTLYSPAASFLDAESDTTVYTFQVTETGSIRVRFGDGVSGKIPTINSDIAVTYRIGVGAVSNSFGVNTITQMRPTPLGVVSAFNPVQPSGGKDPETVDDAKVNGPLSLRALDRAITLQDFEVLAVKTPGGGVKAARASAEDPYDVTVYISSEGQNPIPTGIWYPRLDTGTGLIGSVGRWLSAKKPVATSLDIKAPVAVTPVLRCEINCLPNILQNECILLVRESLLQMFSNTSEVFGKGIPISRVVQLIENTRGVDFVNILEFRRKPSLYIINGQENQLINSTLAVTNIATSISFAKYRVKWLNRSQYTLAASDYGEIRGSYSSTRPRVFDVGQTYSIYFYTAMQDRQTAERIAQFDINITVGAIVPSGGSVWGFTTDHYAGNMDLAPGEIVVPPVGSTGLLNSNLVQIIGIGGI
jgi:hypothetical protein